MRRVGRLLPLPALHGHASLPPEVNNVFHGNPVAKGVVFAEEEQGWRGYRAVAENLDTVVVKVCCVGLEEPEVKHGCVLDEALETWHQSLTEAWTATREQRMKRVTLKRDILCFIFRFKNMFCEVTVTFDLQNRISLSWNSSECLDQVIKHSLKAY